MNKPPDVKVIHARARDKQALVIHAIARRGLLEEVRRVVALECPPENDVLDTYEEGAYKTCRAILARLEKLT